MMSRMLQSLTKDQLHYILLSSFRYEGSRCGKRRLHAGRLNWRGQLGVQVMNWERQPAKVSQG